MATVRIDLEQRRALVAELHILTPGGRIDDPVEVTESLVALHATDPATVFMSIACRSNGVSVADIEDAMYERGVLARVLGMRRTLFVVVPELRSVVQAACTDKIAATENRRLVKILGEAGIGDDDVEGHVARLKAQVVESLGRQQPALGRELADSVDGLRRKVVLGSGRSRTETGLTTLVLSRMAMDGTISRTRPTGSWLSSQFRYELVESAEAEPPTLARASAQLVARYLRRFGPATFGDCQWWTGWTKTQTRRAIEDVGAVEVETDAGVALMMPDALEALDRVESADGWVTFLPALDPTTMGWKERGWYLSEGTEVLFDRFGNAGPTVWHSGRVIGGWGQRPDGTVVHRLLEDLGSEVGGLAEQEAGRIEHWLGGTVVSPRFRAPLERELSG